MIASWLNPMGMVRAIAANQFLIVQLVRREVESQFRGTFLGWLWLFARPLLQLSVYTFVFGVLWRRDEAGAPIGSFSMQLFCGLSLYNLFSQILSRSSQCVANKAGFVRQLVFPLEILPWVQLLASLVLSLPWFVLLTAGLILVYGHLPLTAFLFPLWLIPLVLFAGGFAWFFASLGVYLRDLKQLMPVLLQMIFFVSPVFWQFGFLTGRKAQLIPYLRLNPLATIIEESRKVLIWGEMTDWRFWGLSCVAGALCFYFGFVWFQKTRKGFADVL